MHSRYLLCGTAVVFTIASTQSGQAQETVTLALAAQVTVVGNEASCTIETENAAHDTTLNFDDYDVSVETGFTTADAAVALDCTNVSNLNISLDSAQGSSSSYELLGDDGSKLPYSVVLNDTTDLPPGVSLPFNPINGSPVITFQGRIAAGLNPTGSLYTDTLTVSMVF